MTTYEVKVSRGDRFWIVDVPGIGRATQARNLGEVDAMARDLIAVMTVQPPESIQISLEIRLPEAVVTHLEKSAKLRDEADRASARAQEEVQAAVRELHDRGFTVRDIGKALGVSFQRAHQLLDAGRS